MLLRLTKTKPKIAEIIFTLLASESFDLVIIVTKDIDTFVVLTAQ